MISFQHYTHFVSCSSVNLNTVSLLLHWIYWIVRYSSLYPTQFIKNLKFTFENVYEFKLWFNTQHNRHHCGWCSTKKQRIFILEALGCNLCWTPAVLTDFFVVSISNSKQMWEQDSTSTRVWPIPFKSSQFFVHTLFFYLTLWYSLVGVSWNKHHLLKHTHTHTHTSCVIYTVITSKCCITNNYYVI